jgi:hypothetical protein
MAIHLCAVPAVAGQAVEEALAGISTADIVECRPAQVDK